MYSIVDNQNITATPSIISRDISTVTSHHGGPTQHETTHYSVTIDLQSLSEGWHKIAGYIGVTIFLGENRLFEGLLDYRTFDPLYFAVGGLPNIQDTSSSTSPTSPTNGPKTLPMDPNSNLSSPTTTPITSPIATVASDSWLSQTFVVALLSAVGLMVVILPAALYFKKRKAVKLNGVHVKFSH